jgi:hypothetical protein
MFILTLLLLFLLVGIHGEQEWIWLSGNETQINCDAVSGYVYPAIDQVCIYLINILVKYVFLPFVYSVV